MWSKVINPEDMKALHLELSQTLLCGLLDGPDLYSLQYNCNPK